jgi:N-terminal acetyltransferase B complex non-catalytic subunit
VIRFSEADSFLAGLVQKQAESTPLRGPLLAHIHLHWQYACNDTTPVFKLEEYTALLASYFASFGDALCAFGDLKKYLSVLSPLALLQKSTLIQAICSPTAWTSAATDKEKIKRIRRLANQKKMERYLEVHASAEAKQSEIQFLLTTSDDALPLGMYARWSEISNANKQLIGASLEARERQYGDDFLVLAAHYLVDFYQEHSKISDYQPCLLVVCI